MPPMTGRVIAGRYNLQHPIGRGAMGVVWRARDMLLDRDVAVKEVVISALIGADERHTAYQRTLREARTAARLSHRGVVTVYDVVEEDGRPWIVMELIPSQSLDQVLTVQGRLPVARVCDIGQQLLSALAAAHTAGVLHRDVKPSNVLIANSKVGDSWEERAVLTDFGIAQFEGDPRLTQTGMVMGSPGFTAPERIRGGDATSASDLWSLGATIYAAVEGRGPFEQRGGAITTMSAIINEDAPAAPHAAQLAPLIAALLRRDPSARPSAASAARQFAQVLPQLTEAPKASPAAAHPATVLSAHVPSAAPAAPAPASAPEDAPGEELPSQPADAADKQVSARPAADKQVSARQAADKQVSAKQAAPAAAEPAQAAQKLAVDKAAAQAAPDSAGEAEPAAVAEPAAEAEPDAKPVPESVPDAGPEPAAGVAPSTVATPVIAAAKAKVAEAPPADEPAADAGASGALTVFADPPEAEAASAGGKTVVADEGSGYQPTELAIPAARVTPSPAPPRPAEQRPAPPKPTFTAAKPAERQTPSYSAASPARPQPPAPTPERRPAYGGSSGTGQGHPGGSTSPLPPAAGQYAGPSQSYPDLSRQYAPGAGGRSGRGRGRGRQIAWLVVAVIIAAAVGVGAALALNHHNGGGSANATQSTGSAFVDDTATGFKSVDSLNNPSAVTPSGWWHATVTATDLGSPAVAGFSLDLPPGWTEKRSALATEFTGPGGMLVEVDLTSQNTTNMLAAATSIEKESLAENRFPGYKRVNLQEVPVRNTRGAFWKFTWTPAGSPGLVADDILFAKATPAGTQDYAIYIRSPQSSFDGTALPLFYQILPTFETVPAS